ILNQREYLTQVREAFQNQLDISLNETMRFFTVVTSIFLPLTLLVGWYGMNLRMPEFASNHAYPIVIAFSILFIILSLIFSKKKGWL
ncbi:MAG TPA: CorA family divalent cation transporter, partial [Oscillospiraceae bacterium]|nr:CorA family divalent cation transporter [Oscillospiraceae bacterium]